MSKVYAETWAIVEMHFLTRPHLMAEAREQLARCFDRLMANGRNEPRVLKDIGCRTIQLKYGPAPALHEFEADKRAAPRHHAPSRRLFASAR